MELELYREKNGKDLRTLHAYLSDNKLSIEGYDVGPSVEKYWGHDDYEYTTALDEDNTKKLFDLLGCSGQSDEEKLHIIKDKFGGGGADSALRIYCEEHGIETSFSSWL